jgi:hypothetical protein
MIFMYNFIFNLLLLLFVLFSSYLTFFFFLGYLFFQFDFGFWRQSSCGVEAIVESNSLYTWTHFRLRIDKILVLLLLVLFQTCQGFLLLVNLSPPPQNLFSIIDKLLDCLSNNLPPKALINLLKSFLSFP